jgi:hypothetical protein
MKIGRFVPHLLHRKTAGRDILTGTHKNRYTYTPEDNSVVSFPSLPQDPRQFKYFLGAQANVLANTKLVYIYKI